MEQENILYATGKRKDSIAKVWLSRAGKGNVIVNNLKLEEYFELDVAKDMLLSPLSITKNSNVFDVKAVVMGGGKSGQAGAIRLGISKALVLADPELRGVLKNAGFLTRDARKKERKKYGKRGARASYQFSKR